MFRTSLISISSTMTGALFIAISAPAQAQFVNPGFETGNFTGWETIGNTSIQTAAFGTPTLEGDFHALATTGLSSVSTSNLETFFNLNSGSLNGLGNGTPTEGSGIKQTVSGTAGQTVTFGVNFLTNEQTPTSFNDFSFFSVFDDNVNDLSEIADTQSSFVSSNTIFSEETGYMMQSYTFPADGIYTLGFGVVDVNDGMVDSAILVDTIPEPLTILGTFVVAGLLPRFKKARKVN